MDEKEFNQAMEKINAKDVELKSLNEIVSEQEKEIAERIEAVKHQQGETR